MASEAEIREARLRKIEILKSKKQWPPHPKGFLLRQKIACGRVWFDWPLFFGPREFLIIILILDGDQESSERFLTCSEIKNSILRLHFKKRSFNFGHKKIISGVKKERFINPNFYHITLNINKENGTRKTNNERCIRRSCRPRRPVRRVPRCLPPRRSARARPRRHRRGPAPAPRR